MKIGIYCISCRKSIIFTFNLYLSSKQAGFGFNIILKTLLSKQIPLVILCLMNTPQMPQGQYEEEEINHDQDLVCSLEPGSDVAV